ALRNAKITTTNLRVLLILMEAELSALVCSGPRRGKQHTHALLEERVPPTPPLARDRAQGAPTAPHAASHRPRAGAGHALGSGLSMRDARREIEVLASECPLEECVVDGGTYWSLESQASAPPRRRQAPVAWLLPNFDEYFIAYKERRTVLGDIPRSPTLRSDA